MREAVLTWDSVADADAYDVEVRVFGQEAWESVRCELPRRPGDSIYTRRFGKPVRTPRCVFQLYRIGDSSLGLGENSAYELRVRSTVGTTDSDPNNDSFSPYSTPVVIADTSITVANGDSRGRAKNDGKAALQWKPITDILGAGYGGGTYTVRHRRILNQPYAHSHLRWRPVLFADENTSGPISGRATDITGLQQIDSVYAIQLRYEVNIDHEVTDSSVRVFAARDAYVWPSDRAAGGGERVATFPLNHPVGGRTYAYHICSDTFPAGEDVVILPDDDLRAKARAFIQDALGQWEAATMTGPGESLVTMKYLGTQCANYATYISEILRELSDQLEDDMTIIRTHVEELVASFDLTDFTNEDRDLNEVIYVDVTEDQDRDIIFADVSYVIGLAPCGITGSVACVVRSQTGGRTSDILLPERQFKPSQYFNWDVPRVTFNKCKAVASSVIPKYSTLVHEAGHALGIRGTAASGGTGQQIHHSQVADSSVKSLGLPGSVTSNLCSPTPFDVMAIYALYQTVD